MASTIGAGTGAAFTKAVDELQAAMIVVPSEVFYQPKFTYIWTLAVGRFPDALMRRVNRDTALREIARCFLTGAGMTVPGELARVTGLSRPEAGRGNRALVGQRLDAVLDAIAERPRTAFEIVPFVYGESLSGANAHWLLSKILCYLTHLRALGKASSIGGEPERWTA